MTTPSSYPSIRTDSTEIHIREACATCHGSGEQPWSMTVCRRCEGSGKVERWVPLALVLAALSQLQDEAMVVIEPAGTETCVMCGTQFKSGYARGPWSQETYYCASCVQVVYPPAPSPTRVVHVRRDPDFDVYIGRPMPRFPELRATGWGNPFTAKNLPEGYDNAVDAHRDWIQTQPQLLARLPELRGKRLGCWCAPKGGLPGNLHGITCHGEILAALADGMTEDDESESEASGDADLRE